jgi:hypothetical protein
VHFVECARCKVFFSLNRRGSAVHRALDGSIYPG